MLSQSQGCDSIFILQNISVVSSTASTIFPNPLQAKLVAGSHMMQFCISGVVGQHLACLTVSQ